MNGWRPQWVRKSGRSTSQHQEQSGMVNAKSNDRTSERGRERDGPTVAPAPGRSTGPIPLTRLQQLDASRRRPRCFFLGCDIPHRQTAKNRSTKPRTAVSETSLGASRFPASPRSFVAHSSDRSFVNAHCEEHRSAVSGREKY